LEALKILSTRYEVSLPICDAVHAMIFEKGNPREILLELFLRPTKFEF